MSREKLEVIIRTRYVSPFINKVSKWPRPVNKGVMRTNRTQERLY
jgi:hypothetical protein